MENQKMIKMAVVIDRFAKIVKSLFVVVACVFAVCIPLLLLASEDLANGNAAIKIGSLSFIIADSSTFDFASTRFVLIPMMVAGIVISVICCYGAKIFRDILKPMKEGQPFDHTVSTNLTKLGWVILIGGTVANALGALAETIMVNMYHVEELISTEKIKALMYSFRVDTSYIFCGILVLFLAYIFRYGQQLQQASDETL